jgi:peptidoglycan/xylan/chitin deacetylase (PgdA/CDA1 family)
MKLYWIKTHQIVKWIFPGYVWDMPSDGKKVYLTFDDGPTPEVTEWVLAQLKEFNAKATFFCIGHNISAHREIFQKVVAAGHSVGNHSHDHLKGWNTSTPKYLENVSLCEAEIAGNSRKLFRPPYGKVKLLQALRLRKLGYKIIMWDVLSADFDQTISPGKCLENVLGNINPGSIVIFHDSVKAAPNLRHALPHTLQFLKDNGYECAAIV